MPTVQNFNGTGRWSVEALLLRYEQYARRFGVADLTDLTPQEHEAEGNRWVYPVMDQVIKGIKKGDPACVEIGVEFIEVSESFRFGMILKSNTARLLRNVPLTTEQKDRIRKRVIEMLRTGYMPREFRDYARLARKIGMAEWRYQLDEGMDVSNPWVCRYCEYLKKAPAVSSHH